MVNFTPVVVGATGNAALLNDPLTELDAVIENQRDGEFYGNAVTLTIASGAILITGGYHTIAAESGVADTLDTINGGALGQIISIQADAGDTITIDQSTGNIRDNRGVNFTMSSDDIILLLFDGTNWRTLRPASTPALVDFVYIEDTVASITLSNIPAVDGTLRLVMGFHGDTTAAQPGYKITVNGIATGYNTLSFVVDVASIKTTEHLSDTEYEWLVSTGGAAMLVSEFGGVDNDRLGVKIIDFMNVNNVDFLPSLLSGSSDRKDATADPEAHLGGGALVPAASETLSSIVIAPSASNNFLEGFYALYVLGSL